MHIRMGGYHHLHNKIFKSTVSLLHKYRVSKSVNLSKRMMIVQDMVTSNNDLPNGSSH